MVQELNTSVDDRKAGNFSRNWQKYCRATTTNKSTTAETLPNKVIERNLPNLTSSCPYLTIPLKGLFGWLTGKITAPRPLNQTAINEVAMIDTVDGLTLESVTNA